MKLSRLLATGFLIMLTAACGAKSPEAALAEFYEYEGMEEQLMDPLIPAGDKVVPLVIEKVKDKSMPRRRYAIGFLGNGSYRQALPVLQQILQDTTEAIYFRGDALQSIYQIDEPLGINFAQRYQEESNYVGRIAKEIIAGSSRLKERRTIWLRSGVRMSDYSPGTPNNGMHPTANSVAFTRGTPVNQRFVAAS